MKNEFQLGRIKIKDLKIWFSIPNLAYKFKVKQFSLVVLFINFLTSQVDHVQNYEDFLKW